MVPLIEGENSDDPRQCSLWLLVAVLMSVIGSGGVFRLVIGVTGIGVLLLLALLLLLSLLPLALALPVAGKGTEAGESGPVFQSISQFLNLS